MFGNEPEVAPGADHVARSIEQIGNHVPLPQVLVTHPFRHRKGGLHDLQCTGEITLVGQRTRGDDPALGHQRRRRRALPQLGPQIVDVSVAPQRPVAVGKDSMMVKASVQTAGDLQLRGGLSPLADPVQRETCQLVGKGDIGQVPEHRLHHPTSVLESPAVERIGGGGKPFGVARDTTGLRLSLDVVEHLGCDLAGASAASASRRRCSGSGCDRLVAEIGDRPLVDPLLDHVVRVAGDSLLPSTTSVPTFAHLGSAPLGRTEWPLDSSRRNTRRSAVS